MISILLTFVLALVACWSLVRYAARLGLVERVFAGEEDRKSSSARVPVIGGVAIAVALVLARVVFGESVAVVSESRFIDTSQFSEPSTWTALALALSVGLVDDRFGLRPRWKLLGQLAAGICLTAPFWSAGFSLAIPAWIFGALLAQNALNTFDNADGTASSLTALALLVPAPIAAAAILGFLPSNLAMLPQRESKRPILGDAGSHLLGLLLVLNPLAWPLLALPLLDLARVSLVRLQRGSRPWLGDRRHLAHRLELAGLSRFAVCGVLLGIAAPTALGVLSVRATEGSAGAWILAGGLAATTGLFAFAVRRSPDPDRVTSLRSQPRPRDVFPSPRALLDSQEPTRVLPAAPRVRPRDASSLAR